MRTRRCGDRKRKLSWLQVQVAAAALCVRSPSATGFMVSSPCSSCTPTPRLPLVVPAPSAASCRSTSKSSSPTRLDALFIDPMDGLSSAATMYQTCLEQAPWATKLSTAGVLAGAGDFVAQQKQQQIIKSSSSSTTINSPQDIDWDRLRRFALKGAVSGIFWTLWYENVDTFSAQVLAGSQSGVMAESSPPIFVSIGLGMLLEQFLWCPIIFGSWEIPICTLMNGGSVTSIPSEVQSKLGGLLVSNAKIWTPANFLIYSIPNAEYRILVSSMVDVLWQSVVASVAADCGKEPAISDPGVAMVGEFLQPQPSSSSTASPVSVTVGTTPTAAGTDRRARTKLAERRE